MNENIELSNIRLAVPVSAQPILFLLYIDGIQVYIVRIVDFVWRAIL